MSAFVHRSNVTVDDGDGFVAAHLSQEHAPPTECCGCPNTPACAQYCQDTYGARGGYCEGFLDFRCVCIY